MPPVAIPGTDANKQFTDSTTRAVLHGLHNAEQNLGYAADEWKKGNYLNAASVFFPFIPTGTGGPTSTGGAPSVPPLQPSTTPAQESKPQIVSTPIQAPPKQQAAGGGYQGETVDGNLPGFSSPQPPIDTAKVESRGQGSIDESDRKFTHEEKAIAIKLKGEGKNVKSLAEENEKGVRNADATVDGKKTEFKTPRPGATSGTIKGEVNDSIRGPGQARDIVIDAEHSGLTQAEPNGRSTELVVFTGASSTALESMAMALT